MRELWLENSQRAPAAAEELRLLVDWQNQQPRGLADGGDCLFGVNAANNPRWAAAGLRPVFLCAERKPASEDLAG